MSLNVRVCLGGVLSLRNCTTCDSLTADRGSLVPGNLRESPQLEVMYAGLEQLPNASAKLAFAKYFSIGDNRVSAGASVWLSYRAVRSRRCSTRCCLSRTGASR
jgi:hypothetical protein